MFEMILNLILTCKMKCIKICILDLFGNNCNNPKNIFYKYNEISI